MMTAASRGSGVSKLKIALVGAAVAVAVVATAVPGGSEPAAAGSPAQALRYLTGHRLDLGAPGLVAGIVAPAGPLTGAAGNVSVDTPIPIGSVTKAFTALAVMQLVEAGRTRLDRPVALDLPDFATADPEASARVTVRDLLAQTSGLSTAAGTAPLSRPETTLADQVHALHEVPSSAPGSFRYSNLNYLILGALVERLSGQSYADYLQQHLLNPLDMRHTYTDLAAARAGGLGDGHRIWFGLGVPTGVFYRADFLPSGFLVSTAGDLEHLLSALLDDGRYQGRSVLSPAGVHALLRATTAAASPLGPTTGYGSGWFHVDHGKLPLLVDPGIAQNIHADLVLDPSRHVGVVLLANGESDLYLATIPRFDVAAMNAAAIAGTGHTDQGLVEGFYLIVDLLVLVVLFVYVRALVRVVRQRTPWYRGRWFWRAVAVWRELLVPSVILLELPAVYHEGWRYLLTGDVGCAAGLVAVLGLATFVLRAAFGLQATAAISERASRSASLHSPQPDLL